MTAVGLVTWFGFGTPGRMLDKHLHASEPDVQQMLPIAGRFAEDDLRIREDFEGAAVGDFEARIAVGAGDDQLLRLHRVADTQRLEVAAVRERHLAGLVDDFCRGILGR